MDQTLLSGLRNADPRRRWAPSMSDVGRWSHGWPMPTEDLTTIDEVRPPLDEWEKRR